MQDNWGAHKSQIYRVDCIVGRVEMGMFHGAESMEKG